MSFNYSSLHVNHTRTRNNHRSELSQFQCFNFAEFKLQADIELEPLQTPVAQEMVTPAQRIHQETSLSAASQGYQRRTIQTVKIAQSKITGRLKCFLNEWKSITVNRVILSWICGYKIPFLSKTSLTFCHV